MLRQFVEKIENLSGPKVIEVNGFSMSREELHLVKPDLDPMPECLCLHTLTGLKDYCLGGLDKESDPYTVHVVSHDRVLVLGNYEAAFGRRKKYVSATFEAREFRANEYIDQESFVTLAQAFFVPSSARDELLRVVGNVKDESRLDLADDGVSQTATMKTGIGTLEDIVLKNPVRLAQFRTFPEIEQPETDYILRLRRSDTGPRFALFETTNMMWELETIHAIRDYLEKDIGSKAFIIA